MDWLRSASLVAPTRLVNSLLVGLVCGAVVAPGLTATARDWSTLYDETTLSEAKRTYLGNLRGVWSQDLVAKLPPRIRSSAVSVSVEFPLVGRNAMPLDFYASASNRTVYIPIASVKFLDDLATAVAWQNERGCDEGSSFDYVGMLEPGLRSPPPPPPLQALGVPSNILETSHYVNDVSGKALKSAIYFVMAHELAHVLMQHPGNRGVASELSQRNEVAADEFALESMAGIGVPPLGMVIYFMAAYRYQPTMGNVTEEDYRELSRVYNTHPLASDRIAALAGGIRSRSAAFSGFADTAAIDSVASELDTIARILGDQSMRRFQRLRSKERPLSTLTQCQAWAPRGG